MSFEFPTDRPLPDFGLVCLNCRYRLAGLTRPRCPECGSAIDLEAYVPKGDFPVLIFAGREVRLTPQLEERFRKARIHYTTKLGHTDAMYGLERMPIFKNSKRACVLRSEYFAALELVLEEHLNPTELTEGEPTRDTSASDSDAPDWTCEHCDEPNPATFDICWNCHRDGKPA